MVASGSGGDDVGWDLDDAAGGELYGVEVFEDDDDNQKTKFRLCRLVETFEEGGEYDGVYERERGGEEARARDVEELLDEVSAKSKSLEDAGGGGAMLVVHASVAAKVRVERLKAVWDHSIVVGRSTGVWRAEGTRGGGDGGEIVGLPEGWSDSLVGGSINEHNLNFNAPLVEWGAEKVAMWLETRVSPSLSAEAIAEFTKLGVDGRRLVFDCVNGGSGAPRFDAEARDDMLRKVYGVRNRYDRAALVRAVTNKHSHDVTPSWIEDGSVRGETFGMEGSAEWIKEAGFGVDLLESADREVKKVVRQGFVRIRLLITERALRGGVLMGVDLLGNGDDDPLVDSSQLRAAYVDAVWEIIVDEVTRKRKTNFGGGSRKSFLAAEFMESEDYHQFYACFLRPQKYDPFFFAPGANTWLDYLSMPAGKAGAVIYHCWSPQTNDAKLSVAGVKSLQGRVRKELRLLEGRGEVGDAAADGDIAYERALLTIMPGKRSAAVEAAMVMLELATINAETNMRSTTNF